MMLYRFILYNINTKYINNNGRNIIMEKYVCTVCGYVYDESEGCPEQGIAPGTKWEDIADDFVCPLCGVGKDMFEKE